MLLAGSWRFLLWLLLFAKLEAQPCWDPSLAVGDVVIVLLQNGDRLSGEIQDIADSSLFLQTDIGTAELRCNEVLRIIPQPAFYRFSHQLLWMPSAVPIGSNHFIGMTGWLLAHAGAGITPWFSVVAARSLLPAIAAREQVSVLYGKISSPKPFTLGTLANLYLAGGIALGWLNASNPVHHVFIAGTVHRIRSRISALFFYRSGGPELFTVRFGNFFSTNVRYGRGTVGFALGVDTQLPATPTIHILSELWNLNLAKPTQTALTLGIRFTYHRVTGDFGFALFPRPLLLPFASLWWTPF